jgi:hypothetical protein
VCNGGQHAHLVSGAGTTAREDETGGVCHGPMVGGFCAG